MLLVSRSAFTFCEAIQNLIGVKRIALHEELNQSCNGLLFRGDDVASPLQLDSNDLIRGFFYSVQKILTAGLIGLPKVNWPQPAHPKLTYHSSGNLHGPLDIVGCAGRHGSKQNLLGRTTAEKDCDLIFQVLTLLH